MKLTQIQYYILFVILVLSVFCASYWNDWIKAILIFLFMYECYLLIILLLFSYHWQKRVFMVGLIKQKDLKKQVGLTNLGVSFKEYFLYIYNKRFITSSKRTEQNIYFKERYLIRTKMKEIMVIVVVVFLYILFMLNVIDSFFNRIILLVFGVPILVLLIDFTILRVRYEEGLFIKV